jgi:pilus assembly protein TadC
MAAKKKEESKVLAFRAYRRIGAALPKGVVAYFEKKLKFAGIRDEPRVWLGMRAMLAFSIGSILTLLYLIIYNPIATPESGTITLSLLVGGLIAVIVLFYLKLYLRIADRTNAVEKVLPDFLLLTVSNLRAGMSPFAAFVSASRPEFGALYDEVRLSTAKAGGTASLVDALNEIGDYFDSSILRRTVNLFGKGIRSGGQLTKLLNSNAEEVRRIQDLRAELATSTRTYAIFLGFIIVIVMPFLLSVSTQFLMVFLKLQKESDGQQVSIPGNVPTFAGKVLIDLDQMLLISIGTLVLTSLLASSLLGIIIRGKPIYGVKYFPIFATASIIFFFIAKGVIGTFLSAFG